MKVYINRAPKLGPWGGGAKTVNIVVEELKRRGHKVVFSLEPDIDIIFCFDPRLNQNQEWYRHFLEYRHENKKTKILQRVGDLGTHGKPELTKLVKQTLSYSDYFIFPSLWAYQFSGYQGSRFSIIDNAPMNVFYKDRRSHLEITGTPRIVTHHWSTNPRKGFEIYREIDKISDSMGFSFHYIGQLPPEISLKNHISPLGAIELAKILPSFDIYLTASEEEAGANHVVEALGAGLPVVYRSNGGSIVNYCKDFGLSYDDVSSCVSSINSIISDFSKYKKKAISYNCNNEELSKKYCDIIENL